MSNHPILISKNDLTKWRFDQGIHASSGEPQQTPSPGAHSPNGSETETTVVHILIFARP